MSTIPKEIQEKIEAVALGLYPIYEGELEKYNWESEPCRKDYIAAAIYGYQLATDGREQKKTLSDKIDSEDDIYDRIIPPGIGKGDGIEQMFFNDGYYAGYKFGREELEKECYKFEMQALNNRREAEGLKIEITALQSQCTEKEKECEELKSGIRNFIEWLKEKRPTITGTGAPKLILENLLAGEETFISQSK